MTKIMLESWENMKVMYDSKQNVYVVQLEELEDITIIHTDDVAEAKKNFINSMSELFNKAVNEKLKAEF